jgi:hypothetical protein
MMAQLPDEQPSIESINREFPDALAFTADNGSHYARAVGISIIAAAPTVAELREQLADYFSRMQRRDDTESGGCSV